MSQANRHTFQVLTKRSRAPGRARSDALDWPDNVWMGVSVENQRWTTRIDDLRSVPAAVRFLSCEPLLGPLDLDLRGIDWVIVGGETGHGARRMRPEWVPHSGPMPPHSGSVLLQAVGCARLHREPPGQDGCRKDLRRKDLGRVPDVISEKSKAGTCRVGKLLLPIRVGHFELSGLFQWRQYLPLVVSFAEGGRKENIPLDEFDSDFWNILEGRSQFHFQTAHSQARPQEGQLSGIGHVAENRNAPVGSISTSPPSLP